MRIVVDAMGTDNRPVPDVEGAVNAARAYNTAIILVGDQTRIETEVARHDTTGLDIQIVHASDEIAMTDKPSVIVKSKPDSSMHIGMRLVKDGEADAFVSMGNTGATHAIATLSTLRRIPNVKRPVLTAIYPVHGHNTIFLDMGANADARADWMEQFAVMGSLYAEAVLGIDRPRVATLSNGEEEGKGNDLVREVQQRLQTIETLNYTGHIEPKEVMHGQADVIVVDGFVGNIFLKTFEATITYFTSVMKQEIMSDIPSKLGGLLLKGAFKRVREKLDTSEVGGAPLLGVNGVVIIGHGGANSIAVQNAVRQAILAVKGDVVEKIKQGLASNQ